MLLTEAACNSDDKASTTAKLASESQRAKWREPAIESLSATSGKLPKPSIKTSASYLDELCFAPAKVVNPIQFFILFRKLLIFGGSCEGYPPARLSSISSGAAAYSRGSIE